jgi:hypothetical protein
VSLALIYADSGETGASNRELSAGQIRSELGRVQASKRFAGSRRLSQLLVYLVDAALSGRHESVKEYILAIDVFGRPPEFDPSRSSLVRVQLGRLRAKLVSYYAAEGSGSELIIALPKGACCPVFIRRRNPV